jgi:hypothetical protein
LWYFAALLLSNFRLTSLSANAIDSALHHSQISHRTLRNDPGSLSPTSLADIASAAAAIEQGIRISGTQVQF